MKTRWSTASAASGCARRLPLLAVVLGAAVAIPSSAQARVVITNATAKPVSAASPCTAEPKNAIYSNTGFVLNDSTDFFNGRNLPSRDDLIDDARAGATTDFCIGYTLTPDFTPLGDGSPRRRHAGALSYTTQPTDPVDNETNLITGDDQKDITVTLPRGYAGALANIPTCSMADFGEDGGTWLAENGFTPDYPADLPAFLLKATCAANTQIGEAHVRVSTDVLDVHTTIGTGRLNSAGRCGTSTTTGPTSCTKQSWIYNLEPGPNELGRLGVQLFVSVGMEGPTKFTVSLRLAPDGSGRVIAVVNDAPRFSNYSTPDLYVESIAMRMWGAQSLHPSMAGDFSQNATRCAPANARINVATHGGPAVFDANYILQPDPTSYVPSVSELTSGDYTLTGCDQVPFGGSIDVTPTERRPGVPTGLEVDVNVDQTAAAGILPSTLKDARVTLPKGLELGAQVAADADGLKLCSSAAFAKDDPTTPATCSPDTKVGTVAITSPLITRQLVGDVYLGEQSAVGQLPALYLQATLAGATAPDAPRIKLAGTVTADADGNLTTTFLNNPELRFSKLRLTFPGGPNALFVTPMACGDHESTSRLTPWSGGADAVITTQMTIDQECDVPFAPTVSVSSSDGKVSSKAPQTISIARPDRAPWLTRAAVHLPSGFLADLNAAKECPAADAATGNCAPDSRIGTVTTVAGAGSSPLTLNGKLYLTERAGSDVAGAVIVVPAKVGDLDLGTVVVPGRILLRPTDAGLDFITDVPTRFAGVALHLRQVDVTLDREGFPLTPSACGPLTYSAEFTAVGGGTATPEGQISYTGCKELGFTPKLQAILTGDNTPGGHPGMYVVLTSPQGDAGMKSAVVTLPDGVVVDLQNAKNSCTVAQFNASSCPATAKIGTAKAQVSIVPDELAGNIYLVAIPGKSLPGLGLDFGGRYAQRVLATTATDKNNRVVTSFSTIPDLPLRRLVVDVTSNAKSPLQVSETSPCDANSGWEGAFTAQGGQTSTSRSGLQCAAKPKTLLSAKSGLSFRLFDFGTRNLSYLKLALPKGWSFNASAAKKADAIWVRTSGGTAEVKLAKRSLFVYAKGKTTDVRFKIARSVIKAPRKIKRGATVDLPVRLAFTDGTIQQQTASITLR